MSSQNEQSSSPTNGGVRKVALVTGITGQVYKLKTHINELNLNLIKLINNIYIYIMSTLNNTKFDYVTYENRINRDSN